jgi:hypothetical protein
MWPMLRRSTRSCGFGNDLAVERRRLGVHVPALDPKAARQAFDRDRLGDERVLLGTAERLRVDEREVREIGQVVDDQQPVGLVVHVVGHASPLRIVEVGKVEDLVGIGLRCLAHPDPQQALLLDQRIAPDAELGGESCPGPGSARSGRSHRT